MNKSVAQLGEFGLIHALKKVLGKTPPGIKGIGDDTAVVPLSKTKYMLLTADMLVEGVHFTKNTPPKAVGHKSIACSISDIAAMGGIPKYAVVSLGVPVQSSYRFIADIYQGMKDTARKYRITIVGGDTVRTKKTVINVTLTGEVGKHEVVYRSGARKGDQIFVTGRLGRSLASGWHHRFIPRIAQSQFLVKRFKPSAMIDVSDGLEADLGHILKESKAGAVIEKQAIPRRPNTTLEQALYDGEDFELLFTLPKPKAAQLQKGKWKGFSFTRIGEIVEQRHTILAQAGQMVLKGDAGKGYIHF